MSIKIRKEDALSYHKQAPAGKIEVVATKVLSSQFDLALAYSPGVAEPCKEIQANEEEVYKYTAKGNLVGVITNGTAVLGLGDLGPAASKPVMEGKAVLFKKFAGIDVFDIELDAYEPEAFINIVKALEPTFGGINLEDIKAPESFAIERALRSQMKIPVMHDDQHGTAVVALAATINAIKVVGKKMSDLRCVVIGAGAAGVAITRILIEAGVKEILCCDRHGILNREHMENLDDSKKWLARNTNPNKLSGTLLDATKDTDLVIGVSGPGIIPVEAIEKMAENPIVFALANPVPEIMPEEILGIARIIATGRSDYPNQINNVLAFPGIFRGALDARATHINEEMKLAAANAIANCIEEEDLSEEYIVPSVFNKQVVRRVAKAVKEAAFESGAATATRP